MKELRKRWRTLVVGFSYNSFFLSVALLPCFPVMFSLISLHPFLFNLVTKNTRSPFLSSINLSFCFVIF
jgi:hypothetical protein